MAPCRGPVRKPAVHYSSVMTTQAQVRLTQYAHGGGCACKIPPGELEAAVARLIPARPPADLLIGVEHGDDAAVVQIAAGSRRGRDRGLLHPGGRRCVHLRPDRGRQRPVRRLRRRRRAAGRAQPARLAARRAERRSRRRGAARRPGHGGIGRLPRRRRPQHRRPGAQVRHGCDRACRPAGAAADRRWPAWPAALTDQADRQRRAERPAQGNWRGVPGRDRGDDHAERPGQPAGAGRRDHVRHRRDRLRPARPPVQAGQGQRRHRGHRQRRGAADRRRARRAARWLRARRQPPQPGLGDAARRLRRRQRRAADPARRRADVRRPAGRRRDPRRARDRSPHRARRSRRIIVR